MHESTTAIKIHPTKLVIYQDRYFDIYSGGRKFNNAIHDNSLKNLDAKKNTGEMSKSAQKRIKNTVDYMLYSTKNRNKNRVKNQPKHLITFVTLTLPSKQIHSDNEIKASALNQFLIEIKSKGVHNYVWKAEKQNNGNIHFHIIIDKYIDWQYLRDKWNRIINKLGYVDKYQKMMKDKYKSGFEYNKSDDRSYAKQLKAYRINKACNFTSPNSTDIHKINKIKNLRSYIAKYIAKNESEKQHKIQGRLWYCNGELSKLKGATYHTDRYIEKEIEQIMKENTYYRGEHCLIINFDIDNYHNTLIYKEFIQYMKEPNPIIKKPKPIENPFENLESSFENEEKQLELSI